MVRATGLEPARSYPIDPKSIAATNYAMPAFSVGGLGLFRVRIILYFIGQFKRFRDKLELVASKTLTN